VALGTNPKPERHGATPSSNMSLFSFILIAVAVTLLVI
jgi:hypothetical protein